MKSWLAALLLFSASGCTWHGVLKNDTDIGWGGRTIALTVDPTNENFVLAASPTGGLFETAIGGNAWGHVDELPEVGLFDVKFSPDNADIVIATAIEDTKIANGGGIWLSVDHGKTWSHPQTSIRHAGDGSVEPHSGFGISFVPTTKRVFVGTDLGFGISDDLGAHWRFVDPQPTTAPEHAIYAILGLTNGRVLTYGPAGLWISDNGVNGWRRDLSNIPWRGAAIARALAVSPLNSSYVFLTDDYQNLYLSTDGGNNWSLADIGPAPTASIRQPMVVAVPVAGAQNEFDLYWTQASGVNRKRVKVGIGDLNLSASWFTVNFAHSDPTEIAFAKSNPSTLYAANDGGIEKSVDNGVNWTLRPGVAANRFDALQVYDVKVVLSPYSQTSNDMYFGTQDNNLYASSDNGSTWPNVVVPEGGRFQGPLSKGMSSYTQVHFNDQGSQVYGPSFSALTYIDFPFNHKGEVYYVKNNTFFSFGTSGAKTEIWLGTGAQNWVQVPDLELTQPVGHFAFVSGPADNPSLVVPFDVGSSQGLLRIDNAFNGKNDDEVVTSIPLPPGAAIGSYGFQWIHSISSFGVDPVDPNFIILPDVNNNTIWITTDGGVNWTQRDDLRDLVTAGGTLKFTTAGSLRPNFELSDSQVSVIAFDERNTNHILIGTAEGGVSYSDDHGVHWKKIPNSDRIPNVTSFTFSQGIAPEVAYASSWGRGLWTVSLDVPNPAGVPSPPPAPPHPPAPASSGGPRPAGKDIGSQFRTVLGDAATAERLYKDQTTPTILVEDVDRPSLLHTIVAGDEIRVRLIHWASISQSKLGVLLDGIPIDKAKFSIGRDSVPLILLPPIVVTGRHRLIVKELGSAVPREATSLFEVAVADRSEDEDKRKQRDHARRKN